MFKYIMHTKLGIHKLLLIYLPHHDDASTIETIDILKMNMHILVQYGIHVLTVATCIIGRQCITR